MLEKNYLKIANKKLPIAKIAGQRPGPAIFIIAGLHGDEQLGVKIVQQVIKKLKTKLKSGNVYCLSRANIWGLKNKTRFLAGRDLNRSFPGKPNGHLAEKIAYQIFNFIKKTKPTLVIDIHNDWPNSLPYLVIDPPKLAKNKKIYNSALRFAQKTGWLVIQEKSGAKGAKLLKKTLTGCCLQNNIPAFVLESGDAPKLKKQNIPDNLTAIWRILTYLKMVKSKKTNLHYQPPKKLQGKILKYFDEPKSPKSGRIKFFVRAGEMIRKNQLIGKISSTELIAKNTGIVLGTINKKMVKKDEAILAGGIYKF